MSDIDAYGNEGASERELDDDDDDDEDEADTAPPNPLRVCITRRFT